MNQYVEAEYEGRLQAARESSDALRQQLKIAVDKLDRLRECAFDEDVTYALLEGSDDLSVVSLEAAMREIRRILDEET